MPPVIRVENLSKSYRIAHGQPRQQYRTLRESLSAAATWPIRKLQGKAGGRVEEFWALKDVNLEVQQGEVVGIIGRNGSGKSTLLKILSRITAPTTGRVELHGRVGSLLEVGTGFHPELTGRENIFLNGSILGMSRREIWRKFDGIVDFSGVEKFLDTPVKRYSSGMYVRLAFAVAAFLEPEILIIDEVLAVGDANFQQKCISLMLRIAQSGRTVLLVSHNMEQVLRLCKTAFVLDFGRILSAGNAQEMVAIYLRNGVQASIDLDPMRPHRFHGSPAQFRRLAVVDDCNHPQAVHRCGDDLRIRFEVVAERRIEDVGLAVQIKSIHGARLFSSWTKEVNVPVTLSEGRNGFLCTFRSVRLRPGHRVVVELWMDANQVVLDHIDEAGMIEIVDGTDSGKLSTNARQGILALDYDWKSIPCEAT